MTRGRDLNPGLASFQAVSGVFWLAAGIGFQLTDLLLRFAADLLGLPMSEERKSEGLARYI